MENRYALRVAFSQSSARESFVQQLMAHPLSVRPYVGTLHVHAVGAGEPRERISRMRTTSVLRCEGRCCGPRGQLADGAVAG